MSTYLMSITNSPQSTLPYTTQKKVRNAVQRESIVPSVEPSAWET